jgi:hypothetical protein
MDSETELGREKVNFEAKHFTEEQLSVQLLFENPLAISQISSQSLYVIFITPEIFVTKDFNYLLDGRGSLTLDKSVPT